MCYLISRWPFAQVYTFESGLRIRTTPGHSRGCKNLNDGAPYAFFHWVVMKELVVLRWCKRLT